MLGALFVAALAAANPTPTPTSAPTSAPSAPSSCPTVAPTLSLAPTRVPTSRPSPEPTTSLPSPAPSSCPTAAPTMTKAPTRQRRNWAATGLEIGVDYSSAAICADYLAFGRQLNWGGTPGLVLNDNLFSWDGSDLFNPYYVVYEMSGPYYEANYARNENGMSIELTGDARTSKLYDIGAEIMDHFHECSMTLNCAARTCALPSAPPSPAPSAVPTGMPLPYPTLAPSPYPTPACDADAHLYRLALSGAGWAAGAAFVLDHRDPAEALVVEGGLDAFGGAYARGATVATGDGAEVFVCLWDGCYDLSVRGNATAPARLDFRDADGHRFACDGVGCAESFCALAGTSTTARRAAPRPSRRRSATRSPPPCRRRPWPRAAAVRSTSRRRRRADGAAGFATAAARVDTAPLPGLAILGGAVQTARPAAGVRVAAVATAAACANSQTPTSNALTFSWSGSLVRDGAVVALPPSASLDGRVYETADVRAGDVFDLAVAVSDGQRRNEAAATVTTAASALVAAIAGGDRTVDGGDAVVLDASASWDPTTPPPLAFRWDCAGADVAGAVASFAASGLAPGAAKTCAVTVSSADAREATATATIARRDGAAAVAAAVVGQPAARVNPSAKLVLAGDAPAGDRAWTLDAGVLAGGASLDAAALTRLDAASPLRRGRARAGRVLRLHAPVRRGRGDRAHHDERPALRRDPRRVAVRGRRARDAVLLRRARWTDDAGDLPLSYGFGLRSATGDAPSARRARRRRSAAWRCRRATRPRTSTSRTRTAPRRRRTRPSPCGAAPGPPRPSRRRATRRSASRSRRGTRTASARRPWPSPASRATSPAPTPSAATSSRRSSAPRRSPRRRPPPRARSPPPSPRRRRRTSTTTPRARRVVVGDAAAVASTAGLDAATRTHLVDAVGALLETSAADAAATALDAVGAATLLGAVPGERAVSTCAAQLCVASARDAALATPSVAAAARGDVTLVEYAVDRRGAANLTDAPVARVHVGGGRRRAAAAGGVVRVTFAHPARSPENEALLRNESVDCAARDDVVNGTSCGVDVDCSLFEGFVNPCAAGAACLAYEDAAWGSSGACRAVNATANTTTCACAVDERRSVEVVPSSEIVAREFAAAFRNDPLALGKTRLVLYTLAALAGVLVLATLWGYREDRNDHEKTNEPAETLEPLTPLRTRDRAVQNLNESLPSWARVKNARTFFARLRDEHAFLGYVLAYDEVRPRPLRALHLFTDYLWLYAVEAALFIVAFPDMGCDRYVYEAPCLEPTTAYFPAVKACQWRGADVEPSCAPNATEGASIFTYVFLLLVVSSIMVPLSSVVAHLVDVLVSPGASSAKVEVGGGGDETLKTVDEEAPMGDRVDFVVRETTVALRARRAELQKAVETGAASPKTLARFEVARGFKPKYTVTWRRLFYRGETDDERFARKTRRLGEYARLEQLSPLEQRIYLKNRAEDVRDEHAAEDLPPATRAGRALALVLFIAAVAFPLYYVLVAFQHIAASSKATSREWLKGVSLAVVCDIFLYSPAHVAFFNVYLPSLLRTRLRSLADLRGPSDFEFATPLREGAAAHVAAQKKHLPLAALVLAAQPKPASEATAAAAPRRNAGVAVAVWAAVLLLPELLQDLVVDELIVAGVSALMVLVVEVGQLASRDALRLLDRVGLAVWLASLVGGFVAVVAVAAACRRCYARDEAFSVFPDFLFPKSPQQRPSLWAAPEETFTPLHKIGAFFEDDVVGDDRDDDGDATPLVSPRYKADETRPPKRLGAADYKADEARQPTRLGAAAKLDLLSFDGPLSPEQQQCDALRKTAETELTRLEAHAERQRRTSHDRLERRLHKTERALSPAEARDAEAQHQRTLERVAGRGGESATSTLP
ncbi:hypothetical protein JL720_9074 [Aureococcus anophagefferens]|nr:hypothetical protein JL720_9074 [Aureococcus anophagefferens]